MYRLRSIRLSTDSLCLVSTVECRNLLVLLGFLSGSVSRTETQDFAHLEEDLGGVVDTLELVGTGALGVDGNIWSVECEQKQEPGETVEPTHRSKSGHLERN